MPFLPTRLNQFVAPALLSCVFAFPAMAAEHILVFAGQSNMQGKGTSNTLSQIPVADRGEIANVQGFYCNAQGSPSAPDPWGMTLYNASTGAFWFNWMSWSDVTYPAVGGTWQNYQFWRQSWTGNVAYDHGTDGSYWYLGLNPGEPWSNARQFNDGEDVKEYGPEYTVVRALVAARPGDKFHIVKYAPGGTALANEWDLPDAWGGYGAYQALKQWVLLAKAAKPGVPVSGFFWLQGESDAIVTAYANAYAANLSTLITKARTDFGNPDMPVVIAKIHPGETGPGSVNYGTVWAGTTAGITTVRQAQADAGTLPDVATVETSDLVLLRQEWNQKKGPVQADRNDAVLTDVTINGYAPVHFDAAGIRTIGTRMGAAWLSLAGAANAAPVVDAGADTTITLPAMASLDGMVTDDGLPAPPALTYAWTKVSGPGTVSFLSASAVDTTATFSVAGSYTLRLTANDGALSASDTMTVNVSAAPPVNTAPVVDAGPNVSVTLPLSASLDATVSDDGLPAPPTLTYAWSLVSGPGSATFGAQTAVDTTVSFTSAGVYNLRLTVSDGALSASDTVQVTVGAARERVFVFIGDGNMNSRDAHAVAGTSDEQAVAGVTGYYWSSAATGFSPPTAWLPSTGTWQSYHPWKSSTDPYAGINPGDPWTTIDQPAWRCFGPDGAAAAAIQADLGQPIRVIKYSAQSSSNLITHWMSNPDWDAAGWATTVALGVQYQSMRSWVQQAIAGQNVIIAGVFLVHGQADNGLVSAQKYERAMRALITQLRTDFGANVPVVSAMYTNSTPIRVAQNTLFADASVPHLGWANANGLPVGTEGFYNDTSTEYIGGELGQAWLDLTDPIAPVVSAGADQSVNLPTGAALTGSAVDVGDPLSHAWSQVSGPGVATFANASSPTSGVSFSAAGVYVLRLTVADGHGHVVSDDVQVTVAVPSTGSGPMSVVVSSSGGGSCGVGGLAGLLVAAFGLTLMARRRRCA